MSFEHESLYTPVNAQEVLQKKGVTVGEVVVTKLGDAVRAMVEQSSEGLDPLHTFGVATPEHQESEAELVFRAVSSAVDPEAAQLTMFLRHDTEPETGESILSALSPRNEIFISRAVNTAQAANELMTAVASEK